MTHAKAPIFIGGTNGSGTRVFAQLFDAAGVYQGEPKNYAFEPEKIIQYTRPLVPKLIAKTGKPVYDLSTVPSDIRHITEQWLTAFALEIRSEQPSTYPRWGWKHPRNLYLLPFLDSIFPGAIFVQVVRDGRDMELAGNKGDFAVLSPFFTPRYDQTPTGAAGFWSRVNTDVADWASARLGDRYIISRFEDLCADPALEARRILHAAGLELTPEVDRLCTDFVHRPDTIGRWQSLPDEARHAVCEAAAHGLVRFGYQA